MDFLFWFLLIVFGIAIIRYRFQIYEFSGSWSWAEQYLGNTPNAIVLIGMLVIAGGTAYPFGVFDDIKDARPPQVQTQGKE